MVISATEIKNQHFQMYNLNSNCYNT